MTPESQRIAIAEACGWIREYAEVPTWDTSLNSYKGGYEPVKTLLFGRFGKRVLASNLPDYLNDLNAMHLAEKVLTKDQDKQYHLTLTKIVTGYALPEFFGSVIRASAEQRAKAFLRTIGKWEDAK